MLQKRCCSELRSNFNIVCPSVYFHISSCNVIVPRKPSVRLIYLIVLTSFSINMKRATAEDVSSQEHLIFPPWLSLTYLSYFLQTTKRSRVTEKSSGSSTAVKLIDQTLGNIKKHFLNYTCALIFIIFTRPRFSIS